MPDEPTYWTPEDFGEPRTHQIVVVQEWLNDPDWLRPLRWWHFRRRFRTWRNLRAVRRLFPSYRYPR